MKTKTLIVVAALIICGSVSAARSLRPGVMPTFNAGSASFVHTIAPGAVAVQLVEVDGADTGACIPSFASALEDTAISMTAHVNSYSEVMVTVKNESSYTYTIVNTVKVLNIEY